MSDFVFCRHQFRRFRAANRRYFPAFRVLEVALLSVFASANFADAQQIPSASAIKNSAASTGFTHKSATKNGAQFPKSDAENATEMTRRFANSTQVSASAKTEFFATSKFEKSNLAPNLSADELIEKFVLPQIPTSKIAKFNVSESRENSAIRFVQAPISSTRSAADAQNSTPTATPTPIPIRPQNAPSTPAPTIPAQPILAKPPRAQAYVVARPGIVVSYGRTLVPASFLANGLGASIGAVSPQRFRLVFFGREAEFFAYQKGAIFDGKAVTLPAMPQIIKGELYVPWVPIAQWLGINWKRVSPAAPAGKVEAQTTFLLQYPAVYIESLRAQVLPDRTRVVMTLSDATRITASQIGRDTQFFLSAARRADVPSSLPISDTLMPRAVVQSGNWNASFRARTNYVAPVRWFTTGNPPRLVIDFQRLFEESSTRTLGGGLSMTRIRKGTAHGPVQMFLARIDPSEGWRLRVAPGGYSVLQRGRPSKIARKNSAVIGVNGGFYAPDGAAIGTLLINGEWLRLPWKARTAVAFRPDGEARIGNLQVNAKVDFSGGLSLPLHDLNGWPDKGFVTALTRRFGGYYKLRAGEMAVVVRKNVVLAKPGGGGVPIHADGFTLVASGSARPWLDKIARGERAFLNLKAAGWNGFTSALGGGPRLVKNGRVEVTDVEEAFRSDVRIGLGPRTALGIDKYGRYILLVVDGRQGFYSSGLTLRELAATMQKFGAVDAMNLDGGGSTALAVRGKVVNRPSDGSERSVASVLLVMR